MRELGIDAQWEVINGEALFYECTKGFHNAMQGNQVNLNDSHLKIYEETNREYAAAVKDKLQKADVVIVHDPQPAALINSFPERKGKWVWRCHIDASKPFGRCGGTCGISSKDMMPAYSPSPPFHSNCLTRIPYRPQHRSPSRKEC